MSNLVNKIEDIFKPRSGDLRIQVSDNKKASDVLALLISSCFFAIIS